MFSGWRDLVLQAVLGLVKRCRQVEDGLPVLDGDDSSRTERSAVADPLDLVQDGNGRVARAKEVGVQRVRRSRLDRSVGRDEGLARNLSAEDSLPTLVGALAAEDVAFDLLEVEKANEVIDHGLSHAVIVANPDHDEVAHAGTLAPWTERTGFAPRRRGGSCRQKRDWHSGGRPLHPTSPWARCSKSGATAASRPSTWARWHGMPTRCCSASIIIGGPRRTSRVGSGTNPISSTRRLGEWTPCRCFDGPSWRPASSPGSSPS